MTEQELLLTSVLKCRRVDLFVDRPALTAEQIIQLEEMTERLDQGEPIQYIVGDCEFMGLNLKVNERVLIPRPETELLVESVITQAQKMSLPALHILDLGTGSGNIAVSLAK